MSEFTPQPDPGCFENCPRNHIDITKPNPIEAYARECRAKRCLGPIAVQGFSKDGQYIKGVFCGSRRLSAGQTIGEPADIIRLIVPPEPGSKVSDQDKSSS